MDRSSEVLTYDEVNEAWDDNPTLSLLRSTNARWVLPLFSEHLEFTTEPVSAAWFHQKVATAREGITDADTEAKVSPAEYCKSWKDSGWLVRGGNRGQRTTMTYRLSPHALRALRIVRELIRQQNTISEARLGSIGDAVRKLADMSNPNKKAQLDRIDAQIADLQRRRADIDAGHVRAATQEEMKRQLREVLHLTASLPEDFRQLGAMVEHRHREVSRRATTAALGKGAVVEEYLRENDLLDETPEGRAYRGFAQALGTSELERLHADIEEILRQGFGRDHLTSDQRSQMEGLVSSLLTADHEVQETYLRWTASLRRFLSRTANGRHQRLINLAEEALDAGLAWVQAQPGSVPMPGDVLGIGVLDVKDISQTQWWRDPGPRSVKVIVEANNDPLPEADRAALRLAMGTAQPAVARTINSLLDIHPTVTGTQVYDATPEEFQRLGTILSLLDLGIAHGTVDDQNSERVRILADHGQVLEVALPHVLFDKPVAVKGASDD
ncbi:DUF3375 family protein [Nocardioides sp. YIM B13467]|uniref:DUF3375 family protein n=1 Tax=Nocardioides sp. YIM B13467 TaxID=3366294 RepID=UPI003671BA2A